MFSLFHAQIRRFGHDYLTYRMRGSLMGNIISAKLFAYEMSLEILRPGQAIKIVYVFCGVLCNIQFGGQGITARQLNQLRLRNLRK